MTNSITELTLSSPFCVWFSPTGKELLFSMERDDLEEVTVHSGNTESESMWSSSNRRFSSLFMEVAWEVLTTESPHREQRLVINAVKKNIKEDETDK